MIDETAPAPAAPAPHRWTAVVALLCALGALLAWSLSVRHERALRQTQFSFTANELVADLRSRLQRCERLLLTAAAWAEHGEVDDAGAWADLGRRMGFGEEDWCLDALSWYPRIEHRERAAFEARQRQRLFPSYKITPRHDRAEYYPIARVTPNDELSRPYLGIDPWADPKRRPLLEAAVDTGSVRMTGIQQFAPGTRATLRYASVGPIDAEGHPRAFIGAPLRLDLLLTAMTDKVKLVSLSVVDLADGPDALVAQAPVAASAITPAATDPMVEQVVDHAGRRWQLRITALPGWGDPGALRFSSWVAACGVLLALLATWITSSLERSESRARRLALDYSEVARQEGEAAKRAELVRRTLIEAVPLGVVHINADHVILEANHAAHELLGYPPGALAGRHMSVVHDLDEVDRRCRTLSEQLGRPVRPGRELFEPQFDEHGARVEQEWTLVRQDGSRFAGSVDAVVMSTAQGQEFGTVCILADISLRKRALDDMRYRALHDPLTGLANRAQLEHWVQREAQRAAELQQPFAVMVLDLDRFKQINDTHGHAIGDEVLCEVSRRLRAGLRPADAVARMGGDEFVVVLPTPTQPHEALRVADRLLAAFSAEMLLSGVRLRVTPSVGIAVHPNHGTTLDELLKSADQAMYRAKKAGRNTMALAEEVAAS